MPFKKGEMPHVSNHMGRIMKGKQQWRKKDYKSVTVRLEYDVDPDYQKLMWWEFYPNR